MLSLWEKLDHSTDGGLSPEYPGGALALLSLCPLSCGPQRTSRGLCPLSSVAIHHTSCGLTTVLSMVILALGCRHFEAMPFCVLHSYRTALDIDRCP